MTESDILNKLEMNKDGILKVTKNYKSNTLKHNTIKSLKIFDSVVKSVVPYILVTSATIGIYKIIGMGYPFVLDDEKIYARKLETLENGKIKSEYTYDYNNQCENYLTYTSKWELKDDGYHRYIYKYRINYFSADAISELLNSDNLTIRDLLGDPISMEVDITDSIIENKETISAVVYDEEQNEFKYMEETNVDNNLKTVIILLTLLVLNVILYYKKDLDDSTLQDEINRIKKEYELTNSKWLLMKKLEIRENNLKYLNGDRDAR